MFESIHPTNKKGVITQYYSFPKHLGIDIASTENVDIIAPAFSKVEKTGNEPSGYGLFVILKHIFSNKKTLYAHLQTIEVVKGEYIWQGKKIGEMGNTGFSTGKHLHFELFENDKNQNPLPYLQNTITKEQAKKNNLIIGAIILIFLFLIYLTRKK